MHNKRATLSSFLQSWFVSSNYFINKIVDARFNFDTEDERQDWKVYFKAVQFLPESTDHLIHEFVSMPYVQPKISIEDLCEQIHLNHKKYLFILYLVTMIGWTTLELQDYFNLINYLEL